MAGKEDLSWWQKVLLQIITSGPKLRHLAIVMDGNRRFARKLHQDPVYGHLMGSRRFFRILEMVQFVGITELTVYAFSVENFRRPAAELSPFMDAMLVLLQEMLDGVEEYRTRGTRLRFIGELKMFSQEHQRFAELLADATADQTKFRCNFAVGYTSRIEIAQSIRNVAERVQKEEVAVDDVDDVAVERFLYTHGGQPVDLIVRTSGESRLSDFLLWQNNTAVLHFSRVLWPDFGALRFIEAILHYQFAVKCRDFAEYRRKDRSYMLKSSVGCKETFM
uniref:Alkyl transferase n=1 Tax=Lutzomyia longipalpis TaxID=7200 RepID=A0A1B0CN48_LUTLO